jgi:serine/threonine protein kinase
MLGREVKCRFCAEPIQAEAIKCKHCGTMLASVPKAPIDRTVLDSARKRTPITGEGVQMAATGALAIEDGLVVREYEFVSHLGTGGMGEVWRARHIHTEQVVAIKVTLPELMLDRSTRDRFVEEARVMAGLKHDNIVTFHGFFEEQGRFFLIMEYVPGDTLAGIIAKEGQLDCVVVAQLATGIAQALAYSHALVPPLIHRDIKPANVMVRPDNSPVLTDFGIAKALGRARMTRTRGVVGTYEFMSPEQVRGDEVSPATDIYSFGITLYQMLSGRVPFVQISDTGFEVMEGHAHQDPQPISDLVPDCPSGLAALVHQCLAKDSDQRFPSGLALLDALDSLSQPAPNEPLGVEDAPLEIEPLQTTVPPPPAPPLPRAVTEGPNEAPEEPDGGIGAFFAEVKKRVSLLPRWKQLTISAILAGLIVLLVTVVAMPEVPPPPNARLTVQTTPPGATLKVAGEPRGTTPWRGEIPTGTVSLELFLEGYEPLAQEISLEANEERWLTPTFLGTLEIDSFPQGMPAIVDDDRRCTTPCRLELAAGAHKAEWTVDGEQACQKEVAVEPGQIAAAYCDVRASLGLVSEPIGAAVFLDGRKLCRTPCQESVMPGFHDIVWEFDGRRLCPNETTLAPTESKTLECDARNRLRVTKTSTGQLTIDGEVRSAGSEYKLLPGKHSFSCGHNECRSANLNSELQEAAGYALTCSKYNDSPDVLWSRTYDTKSASRSGEGISYRAKDKTLLLTGRQGTDPLAFLVSEERKGEAVWTRSNDSDGIYFPHLLGDDSLLRFEDHYTCCGGYLYIERPNGSSSHLLSFGSRLSRDAGMAWLPDGQLLVFGHYYYSGSFDSELCLLEWSEDDSRERASATRCNSYSSRLVDGTAMPKSNFIVVGESSSHFGWAGRLDDSGKMLWHKGYGQTQGRFAAVAAAGKTIVLAGSTSREKTEIVGKNEIRKNKSMDGWLVFIDEFGDMRRERAFGGAGDDQFNDIVALSNGFLLAGQRKHEQKPGSSGWLVRVDDQGNKVWEMEEGSGQATFSSAVVLPDGGIAVVGTKDGGIWLVRLGTECATRLELEDSNSKGNSSLTLPSP